MGQFLDRYFWWLPVGAVPEISAQDLKKEISKMRARPQLLDVRTDKEWRQGAIRGTVLVPISILKSQIDMLPFDRNQPVVAICRSAHRSIPAVRILRGAGFSDVRQLQGGMLSWQGHNYPISQPR